MDMHTIWSKYRETLVVYVNNENDLFRSSKIMTYGGHSSEKELLMAGAGQGGYNTGVTGVSGGGPESNI